MLQLAREPLDMREPMTISEAAALCGVHYNTFLQWVMKGVVPHERVGPNKSIRVLRRDVEKQITDFPANTTERGFVYFVVSAGLVKIGLTGDVQSRIDTIQGSSATQVTLIGVIPRETYQAAQRLERLLHRQYRSKRKHGEWFEVSIEEARALLKTHRGREAKSA